MKNAKCNIQRWSIKLRQGKTKTLMEEATVKQELYSHNKRKGEDGPNPSTLYIVKNHLSMAERLLTHPSTPARKAHKGLCAF